MRHTFLLILSLLTLTATARERSLEAMQRVAEQVLTPQPPKGGVPTSLDCNAPFRGLGGLIVLQANEHFTVLGYPSANGFAVIANDDDVEPVLGYSTTAAYDSINVPDGLQWWMSSVERALAARQSSRQLTTNHEPKTIIETLNIPSEVSPMLTTRWGQEQPFNLLCPKKLYSNGYMVTGCIATAMAQVMKYYNWPERGDGDLIYNFAGHVYADFASTAYDWDNMLNAYKKNAYTDAEANAVAQLMLHCGVSVNMRYDDSASGSQAQYVPPAMRSHFRYNPNVNYRNRMLHTDAEWMSTIYKELAAGRPIIYTGQDSKMSYGHAFVFDGYDADGLVHVNWGWDGGYDGYFDINILNSGYMGLTFTDLQSMVVGISPQMGQDDDIEHSIEIGLCQDLSLYSTGSARIFTLDTSELQVYCLNDYDLVGTLAMVMPTPNGTRILATLETFKEDEPLSSFTYLIPQNETYTITIPFGLANGKYNFFLAFKEEGRDEWQPLYVAEGKVGYFQLDKQGSAYNVVGVIGNCTTDIKDVMNAPAIATNSATYNLSGQQVGNDYRGIVIKNGKKIKQ